MTRPRAQHLILLPLLAMLPASCTEAPELQGRYELDGADFARTITRFLDLGSEFPVNGRREVWLLLKRRAVYKLELYDDGTFRAVHDFEVVKKVSDLPRLLKSQKAAKGSKRGADIQSVLGDGSKADENRVTVRGLWRDQGFGQIELERTHIGDRAAMDFVTASYTAGTLTLPVEVNREDLTLRLNRRGNAAPAR
jgi:hypothetical protein